MKISYVSDIHLEFAPDFTLDDTGDVLILAGDIVPIGIIYRPHIMKFFNDVCKKFKNIIYIMGNHEFYGADINDVNVLKSAFKGTNITILDNDIKIIDNVKFIGGTMWTDFNKADPLSMMAAPKTVSDFRKIKNGEEQFTAYDWLEYHGKFLRFLEKETTEDYINVVCTHHSPHLSTISDQYKDNYAANGCYASDLTKHIKNIKYWIYGHTHEGLDCEHDDCKIVSNPRGYPNEMVFHKFKPKSFII